MTHISHGRTIGRLLAIIALLLVGAGAMAQEAAAQPGPGGEPIPDPQPKCEVTPPDLVITSARLGYDSARKLHYLDVVVRNRSSGCGHPAGTFRVTHRTNDHPTTVQGVYVDGLGAGASRTVRFTNAPRCGYSETLRGVVTADSFNNVAESNESNNTYAWHHVC